MHFILYGDIFQRNTVTGKSLAYFFPKLFHAPPPPPRGRGANLLTGRFCDFTKKNREKLCKTFVCHRITE